MEEGVSESFQLLNDSRRNSNDECVHDWSPSNLISVPEVIFWRNQPPPTLVRLRANFLLQNSYDGKIFAYKIFNDEVYRATPSHGMLTYGSNVCVRLTTSSKKASQNKSGQIRIYFRLILDGLVNRRTFCRRETDSPETQLFKLPIKSFAGKRGQDFWQNMPIWPKQQHYSIEEHASHAQTPPKKVSEVPKQSVSVSSIGLEDEELLKEGVLEIEKLYKIPDSEKEVSGSRKITPLPSSDFEVKKNSERSEGHYSGNYGQVNQTSENDGKSNQAESNKLNREVNNEKKRKQVSSSPLTNSNSKVIHNSLQKVLESLTDFGKLEDHQKIKSIRKTVINEGNKSRSLGEKRYYSIETMASDTLMPGAIRIKKMKKRTPKVSETSGSTSEAERKKILKETVLEVLAKLGKTPDSEKTAKTHRRKKLKKVIKRVSRSSINTSDSERSNRFHTTIKKKIRRKSPELSAVMKYLEPGNPSEDETQSSTDTKTSDLKPSSYIKKQNTKINQNESQVITDTKNLDHEPSGTKVKYMFKRRKKVPDNSEGHEYENRFRFNQAESQAGLNRKTLNSKASTDTEVITKKIRRRKTVSEFHEFYS